MRVKRESDDAVTKAGPAKPFSKSEFWATAEGLLRGYLERGTGLREAAILIGASYPAAEAKARRLGIWPRRREKTATEVASASEWVLAGYGGENDLGPSGELPSAPDLTPHALILEHPDLAKFPKLRNRVDRQIVDRAPKRGRGVARGYRGFPSKEAYEAHYSDVENYRDELPAMARYAADAEHNAAEARGEEGRRLAQGEQRALKRALARSTRLVQADDPEPIAADLRGEEERVGGAEVEQRGIDADQIPSKRKRTTRPRPSKLILSAPIEAAENDAKMVIQLDATPAPTKRQWDFPPPGGCLFPFGDVGRPGFGFCAEPVVKTGVPYCQAHIQRVYGRGVVREEVE